MQIDEFIIISPREFEEYTKQKARITALVATNKFIVRELECKDALIGELRGSLAAQVAASEHLKQRNSELLRFAKRVVAMAESAPECVLDRRLPL